MIDNREAVSFCIDRSDDLVLRFFMVQRIVNNLRTVRYE